MKSLTRRKERPMRFLPIGLDVLGKKVVVVGGGKVALQKLKIILLFGAKVTVVASDICDDVRALPVTCVLDQYRMEFIHGALLVYACTSDRHWNRQIAKDAASAGILCNVADDAEACVFISPAVQISGDIVFSVNSQGRSPALAREVRDLLGEKLNEFLRCRD